MTISVRNIHRCLLWLVVIILGGIAISAPLLLAQSLYGSIVGTVRDSTGAILPGIGVTAVNLGTNGQQKADTDEYGSYRFLNLIPGRYRLEFEKAGFQHLVRADVGVTVQAEVRIDAILEVGQTSQTIEITAETPLLNTESATVSQVIENQTVREMPLNGRNIMNLVALSPGVVPQASAAGLTIGNGNAGTATVTTAWGNYQIGGGMANQNSSLLDGSAINQAFGNAVALVPAQDTIQEFRVSSQNVGVDSGRSSGGIINFTTKSGTNTFHGSAYEYLRNHILNANAFFNNRSGIDRPKYIQSQYGATLGGPILKNKLFMFLAAENIDFRLGGPSLFTVPTAAMRNGDFSGPGIPNIYDPLTICGQYGNPACPVVNGVAVQTRQQFPGNRIPANRIDPVSNLLSDSYSLPNTNGTLITNNYAVNQYIKGYESQQNARFDYTLSPKQSLFGRYTFWRGGVSPGDPFWPVTSLGTKVDYQTHYGVIGDTYVFSPNTVGDVRVSFLQFKQRNKAQSIGEPLARYGPAWAAMASQTVLQARPGININSQTPTLVSSENFTINHNQTWGFNGNLTHVVGRHSLKSGGEFRRIRWYQFASTSAVGQYQFDNGFTAQNPLATSGSGYGFASFLLGFPASAFATEIIPSRQYMNYAALYVQDSFKATNKLLLIAGLRWENPGQWSDVSGNAAVFLPNATDPFGTQVNLPLKGQVALVNSELYPHNTIHPPNRDLFAPRFGFTYLLSDKTVARGGYGVMYIPSNVSTTDVPYTTPAPGGVTQMTTSLNGGITPAATYTSFTGSGTAGTFSNPFPAGLVQPPGRNAEALRASVEGTSLTAPIPDHPFPYMQQWNLSFENQSVWGMLLGIGYVGAKGTHLPMNGSPQLNQLPDQYNSLGAALLTQVPNPFFGKLPASIGALAISPTVNAGQLLRPYPQFQSVVNPAYYVGSSTYHALQAKLEKRFGGAGIFGANYTWAKLLSNTDSLANGGVNGTGPGTVQDWNNLAAEKSLASFDVAHRAVINYVLDLPIGRGKRLLRDVSGIADKLISGWAINGITTFQSGFPLNMQASATVLSSTFGAGTARPNIVPGCQIQLEGRAQDRLNKWFNTACFTAPSSFGYGNAPRTLNVRGMGISNFDFALAKNTTITERLRVQFRAEAFNVFNRVQFNPPGTVFGISTFGVTSASVASQANQPRLIQLALKLEF